LATRPTRQVLHPCAKCSNSLCWIRKDSDRLADANEKTWYRNAEARISQGRPDAGVRGWSLRQPRLTVSGHLKTPAPAAPFGKLLIRRSFSLQTNSHGSTVDVTADSAHSPAGGRRAQEPLREPSQQSASTRAHGMRADRPCRAEAWLGPGVNSLSAVSLGVSRSPQGNESWQRPVPVP